MLFFNHEHLWILMSFDHEKVSILLLRALLSVDFPTFAAAYSGQTIRGGLVLC